MIILTGAGGFIGSVMLGFLNKKGIDNITIVDNLTNEGSIKNLAGKKFKKITSTHDCFDDLRDITAVIHLGANANTLDKTWNSYYEQNIKTTRKWSTFCQKNNIPFIFASSAAIYGNNNVPLNFYALSKQLSEFEIEGVILRLFNVYGPNEYHKGRMASVIYNWYQQLQNNNSLKLFENSHSYFRDFIWVEDICETVFYFLNNYHPGIYELGTGKNYDFETVANYVLKYNGKGTKEYIPMPSDLINQYQTHTKANTSLLKDVGVTTEKFLNVENGIEEYFWYLKTNRYF